MKISCEGFADRLVDYVDGNLPEAEAQKVMRHLAGCESCRQTTRALERSLTLAAAIWSDNLTLGDSGQRPTPLRRSRRVRFYAVAAGIVIAASGLLVTVSDRRQGQPSLCVKDVERQVARAGAAAELLAATQILARCQGTESIVERQHQFILEEYAGTPAAESIRAQYGSRLGGIP